MTIAHLGDLYAVRTPPRAYRPDAEWAHGEAVPGLSVLAALGETGLNAMITTLIAEDQQTFRLFLRRQLERSNLNRPGKSGGYYP